MTIGIGGVILKVVLLLGFCIFKVEGLKRFWKEISPLELPQYGYANLVGNINGRRKRPASEFKLLS